MVFQRELHFEFQVLDATDIGVTEEFDFLILNATLTMLEDKMFEDALSSAANALKADGKLVVFDYFHPWQ